MTKENKFIHVSIDIETMGTRPNAAVLSIAAVRFIMPDAGKGSKDSTQCLQERFNIFINPQSWILDPDFTIDDDTRKWWSDDARAEAKNNLMKSFEADSRHYSYAADRFYDWLMGLKSEHGAEIIPWFQGKDFDLPILKHLFYKADYDLPFDNKKARCARDFMQNGYELLTGDIGGFPYQITPKYKSDSGCSHDALFDCERTAWNVCQMQTALLSRLLPL